MEQQLICSVVVPVYNEEAIIEHTYQRLRSAMDATRVEYELLFVNDGSRDRTPVYLAEICRRDRRAKLLNFSRNFGHQFAISAGIDNARGATIVTIDGDLQDPPELIGALLEEWRQGFDVVYARRIQRRGETMFKRYTAAFFYRFLQSLTEIPIPAEVGDFRLIDRKVAAVLRSMPERHRFVRGMVSWLGFRQTFVEYVRDARKTGVSKYSWHKMTRLASDAIFSFSAKPVQVITGLGVAMVGAGLLGLIGDTFTRHLLALALVTPVVIACTGLVLTAVGVVGSYVIRIYDESRQRPLYIVASREGFGEEAAGSRSVSTDPGHKMASL